MYLRRLEISGFKSFAKKTTLLFETPITSIVGPNGSGKSNVVEAFRWVLGEQSLKSLRGKRGEDLIFNGGNTGSKLSRASVVVVFDNSDKKFNVDFDEVSISRTVYSDGVNDYMINGSSVRLKDIIELLSGVSLGPTGHHIISQGEADRILNSSIKDRKEMIEEALGLKVYQWKISESERKLEKTEENIKQVESLRREIAPHIKFLKKQVEKIEKTDEMRKELGVLYREYLKREEVYIKARKEFLKNELEAPKKELEDVSRKIGDLSLPKEAEGNDEKVKVLRDVEKELHSIRMREDELSRKIGRLEGMIEIKESVAANLEEKGVESVPFEKVESLTREIEGGLMEAESASNWEEAKSLIVRVRGKISAFMDSFKTAETKRDNSQEELEKMRKEKKESEEEMDNVKTKEKELSLKHSEIKAFLDGEAEKTRGAEREVMLLRMRKTELESKISSLRGEEEKISILEVSFKEEIREGIALVNREILNYESYEIDEKSIMDEPRSAQEDRRRIIERIKIRLEDMGVEGTDVLEEYKQASERDQFLEKELGDLYKSAESIKQVIVELKEKLNVEFKEGIEKINKEFDRFFSLMFDGGSASLRVVKEEKRRRRDFDLSTGEEGEEGFSAEAVEMEEGIDINVSLPRKKIKGLVMLSGGERALTSIALLFAMSQVNPPPFLILDETDAALDEANSRKYGDMIESLSKYSQLILITHNRETMSRAGIIYGVTMASDSISRLISIKFDEAVEYAK